MDSASLADLRRIAEALQHLRGGSVHDATLRHDARQLRIGLDDGTLVLISATADANGRPRLDVDTVRTLEEVSRPQLEVHFD